MKASIYYLAAEALAALRRKAPRAKVAVVSLDCEICGRTHRMGLGAPRCTAPAPVVAVSRENPAYEPIFGKALAAALLCGCLSVSGCASSHFYLSGVTLGAGETGDGKEITAGLQFAPNPYAYKSVVPLYSK